MIQNDSICFLIKKWFKLMQNDAKSYKIELIQFKMIQIDTKWKQYDSNWFKTIQIDSNWFKNFQINVKWFKMIRIDSNWFKLIQNFSRWFKLIQTDSN